MVLLINAVNSIGIALKATHNRKKVACIDGSMSNKDY